MGRSDTMAAPTSIGASTPVSYPTIAVTTTFPRPLRHGLTWTDSVIGQDLRPTALASLIEDAFGGAPCFIWGAGASVPLVAPRLSASAITEFVRRHRTYVPYDDIFAKHRVSVLAAILEADVHPGMTDREVRWVFDQRAALLGLEESVYADLRHLCDGGLIALVSQWLSPEPTDLAHGPKRAGYDLLRFVPRDSTVITTNQDRLARQLAPHLNVIPLNGEVPSAFVDHRIRTRAIELLASSHHAALPDRFYI